MNIYLPFEENYEYYIKSKQIEINRANGGDWSEPQNYIWHKKKIRPIENKEQVKRNKERENQTMKIKNV